MRNEEEDVVMCRVNTALGFAAAASAIAAVVCLGYGELGAALCMGGVALTSAWAYVIGVTSGDLRL